MATLTSRVTLEHLRAIDFWRHVEVGPWGQLGYCWAIKGQRAGYSNARIPAEVTGLGCGVAIRGHRVAMSLTLGRLLATEEQVDHLCHNPSCVKPAHLDVVDRAENLRRRRPHGALTRL